jgi:hypothetical protein
MRSSSSTLLKTTQSNAQQKLLPKMITWTSEKEKELDIRGEVDEGRDSTGHLLTLRSVTRGCEALRGRKFIPDSKLVCHEQRDEEDHSKVDD